MIMAVSGRGLTAPTLLIALARCLPSICAATGNDPSALIGVEKRFVKFNGGVGLVQLAWLTQTLQEAAASGQKVDCRL